MISTPMPHLKKVLGCVTIMSGLMVNTQTLAADMNGMSDMNGEDNRVADDVSVSMSHTSDVNGEDNRVADDVSMSMSRTSVANGEDNSVAANVLKISGWYERYSNGQIVLYPVFKISPMSCLNGISDMNDEINGMPGMEKGNDMDKMLGMFGGGTENLKPKLPQMTYGRFWIDKDGNLVLCPSHGKKPSAQGIENRGDVRQENQ